MTPVEKAIWYIEGHFGSEISLQDIADSAGVSRHYLARAFAEATGRSVMQHVRGRRLSQAAVTLAAGAPDILQVALDAGYGSHEAFTRAFRDAFGHTPEAVRTHGSIANLKLVEPMVMTTATHIQLAEPRIETGRAMLIAGLGRSYACDGSGGIPAQWQQFARHLGHIPGQIGNVAYGVICNFDESGNYEYVSGVEVKDFGEVPQGFTRVRLAQQSYLVFTHRDHISAIRATMNAIWNAWLPQSAHEVADAPSFERYDERFDARTGLGGLEIWVPITNAG